MTENKQMKKLIQIQIYDITTLKLEVDQTIDLIEEDFKKEKDERLNCYDNGYILEFKAIKLASREQFYRHILERVYPLYYVRNSRDTGHSVPKDMGMPDYFLTVKSLDPNAFVKHFLVEMKFENDGIKWAQMQYYSKHHENIPIKIAFIHELNNNYNKETVFDKIANNKYEEEVNERLNLNKL